MRTLKYLVATSLDGFIAEEDGSFNNFIMEGHHVTDFQESLQLFDTVLMGRKTYEVGLKFGVTSPYPTMKQYVFSQTMQESPDQQVELVSDNGLNFIKELKHKPGKDIWLCGGGKLATLLFTERLIDEIVVKVNPILFGSGIPLSSTLVEPVHLELINSKRYDNGIMLLSYLVKL